MFNFLTGYTWFGTVYAFHKTLCSLLSVNCPKPGYKEYPIQKFSIFLK